MARAVERGDLAVPSSRLRVLVDAPARSDADYVLYWMTAARRTRSNYALQHASYLARQLELPLLVFEPLRVDYPWASDRLHRFVLDGMRANAKAFAARGVRYFPYVEPRVGAAKGLLRALAARAGAVVADDSPCGFLPSMLHAAAGTIRCRLEAVDSNGLLPLAATERVFRRAFDLRRFLQRELSPHLEQTPVVEPLSRLEPRPPARIPASVERRWPAATPKQLLGGAADLGQLPIDHGVAPTGKGGGAASAQRTLRSFVREAIFTYDQPQRDPTQSATSGLSAYLHFGHLSSHEVFRAVAHACDWEPSSLGGRADGQRLGWWGMGPGPECFLDQLITWRELGMRAAAQDPRHASFDGLPDWARATLELHAGDPRPHVYTRAQFDAAGTHDALWNASQHQLVAEGCVHGYLRMLWGKKVLHWSADPREAFESLVALNDRYALDGRDPNSYSSIGWIFGRYDRAWGPEREVFGKVRYMSCANTHRKLRTGAYIERWGQAAAPRSRSTRGHGSPAASR